MAHRVAGFLAAIGIDAVERQAVLAPGQRDQEPADHGCGSLLSSESVNEPLDQTDIFQMTSRFAKIIPPYHRRGNRVFSTAKLLVKRHGEDAPIHTAMRSDASMPRRTIYEN